MVSIILPVYNGARFLKEAVDSVRMQTYAEWELLVVDDGSTDETPTIIERFAAEDSRIHYYKNEKNLGIQKTLNRGLQYAKGEYIARIDDDDIWADPEKLAKQIAFLAANPDHILVGTGVIEIDEAGGELFRYYQPSTDEKIRRSILRKNCFAHSSVMFRAKDVQEYGGYSEATDVLHIEDYDLWLRLGKRGKFANLPFYGLKFRLRPGSLSSKNKVDLFRKDQLLVRKYRSDYPHGSYATFYAWFRLHAYSLYALLPSQLRHLILGIYKKI